MKNLVSRFDPRFRSLAPGALSRLYLRYLLERVRALVGRRHSFVRDPFTMAIPPTTAASHFANASGNRRGQLARSPCAPNTTKNAELTKSIRRIGIARLFGNETRSLGYDSGRKLTCGLPRL